MLFGMSCDSELRRGIYTCTDNTTTMDIVLCYVLATASVDVFQRSWESQGEKQCNVSCAPEAS